VRSERAKGVDGAFLCEDWGEPGAEFTVRDVVLTPKQVVRIAFPLIACGDLVQVRVVRRLRR